MSNYHSLGFNWHPLGKCWHKAAYQHPTVFCCFDSFFPRGWSFTDSLSWPFVDTEKTTSNLFFRCLVLVDESIFKKHDLILPTCYQEPKKARQDSHLAIWTIYFQKRNPPIAASLELHIAASYPDVLIFGVKGSIWNQHVVKSISVQFLVP